MTQSGDARVKHLQLVEQSHQPPLNLKLEHFAAKVQEYRRASGRSQKELAEALALHPKVLSRKLSPNSDAFLTHQEIKQVIKTLATWRAIVAQSEAIELLEIMGLTYDSFDAAEWEAEPLSKLHTDLRPKANSFTLLSNTPSLTLNNNLPVALTSFVGRTESLSRLCQILSRKSVRLITLVGMGGTGKTRLALQVAHDSLADFEHGVWFVALAGVRDPNLLAATIAHALGLDFKDGGHLTILEQLKTYLRPRQLLLILDNFEQLLEAAPQVSELLEAAAGLKILVTSRSPLQLYGEYKYKVAPLKLPELKEVSQSALMTLVEQSEAVQLFVERAQAANLDFELAATNSLAVAQICALLEGLPLAIELAAARTRSFSIPALLEQLSRARLPLLTNNAYNLPARQQTLQNTLQWSFDLLEPEEQAWFVSLAIFKSGWSLEAAHAVCAPANFDSNQTFTMLNKLLDKSLIEVTQPATDNSPNSLRFNMLETMFEFAQQLLIKQKQDFALQERHLAYHLQLATQTTVQSSEQGQSFAILAIEFNNFRAALDWVINLPEQNTANFTPEGNKLSTKWFSLGLQLATALSNFWSMRGYWREGFNYLENLLTQSASLPIETLVRIKALNIISHLAMLQGDYEVAKKFVTESLTAAQAFDSKSELATAHTVLGEIALNQGNYGVAQAQLQAGLFLFRQLDESTGVADVLTKLGIAYRYSGNFQAAQQYTREGLELCQQLGNKQGIAYSVTQLGHVASLQREIADAQKYYEQGLVFYRELDMRFGIAGVLSGLGSLAIYEADNAAVERYFQEALSLYRELGNKIGVTATLNNLGNQALYQGDDAKACQYFEEAKALSLEIGDKQGVVLALYRLGAVKTSQAKFEEARQCYEQSRQLALEIGDEQTVPKALRGLGDLALLEGQIEIAKEYCDQSLTLARASGGKFALARTLLSVVLTVVAEQNLAQAKSLLQECVALIAPMRDKFLLLQAQGLEVVVTIALGERAKATELIKQCEDQKVSLKLVFEPPIRQAYAQSVEDWLLLTESSAKGELELFL